MNSELTLEIVNRSSARIPRAFLEDWVRRLASEAAEHVDPRKYRGRDFVIAFVSDREMKSLNREFRGKNKATDVLSFEGTDSTSLGELAIAPAVITKQAKEHGLRVREELGYMVIHGFLHLLGYDHEKSERDAKRMFKIQDELFERLLKRD